jgi:sugar phosphate isomerase/epimerase
MKFAICNEIFQGWSPDDTFAFAARTGYEAVEIAPFTLASHVGAIGAGERQRLRDAAARAGIAISGIHWVLVKTEGLHLTHPEPEVRGRTARYFVDLVNFCADLGGRFMVVGSPKQRSLLPGVTLAAAGRWALEVLGGAVKRAEDRGVTICLEPLAPAETDFINTAAEAIRLTRELASPALKIILDVKAMSSEARPIPQIIREAWPHFAYFHANDPNLKGPGFGDLDFRPIAAALREVGYDGYVSVEVFNFDEGPEVIATRSLACLRAALAA